MSEGCICQNCGDLYKVDFLLPDELWAEITDKNLLCGVCIVRELEKRGFDYWHLIKPKQT